MPKLHLTDEAHRAVVKAARGHMQETATRRPDGTWDVPVSDEVIEGMKAVRLAGESDSDCIIRLAAFAAAGGKRQ